MITQAQFNSSIVPYTLQYEGGYSNHKNDVGGETYRGISRVFSPNWSGWATIDKEKKKTTLGSKTIIASLEDSVKQYYWDNYFVKYGYNQLNDTNIALQCFDFKVNGGMSNTKLVEALAAIGVKTAETTFSKIAAICNKCDSTKLANALINVRKKHYDQIIKDKPDQAVFKNGWYSRLKSLKSRIANATTKQKVVGGGVIFMLIAVAVFCVIMYRRYKHKQIQTA